MQSARNFIGGEWLVPGVADWRDIVNPATGDVIGRVPMCGNTEVTEAVRAAREAFPAWRATPVVASALPLLLSALGAVLHEDAANLRDRRRNRLCPAEGARAARVGNGVPLTVCEDGLHPLRPVLLVGRR